LGPDAASRNSTGEPVGLDLPGEAPECDMLPLRHNIIAALSLFEYDTDVADGTATVAAALAALDAVSVVTWDMVREATASDETFVSLVRHLEEGSPSDCRQLLVELRPFHQYASSLCVVDSVVLMGQLSVDQYCKLSMQPTRESASYVHGRWNPCTGPTSLLTLPENSAYIATKWQSPIRCNPQLILRHQITHFR
jgi:hypothetical protein